MLLFKWKERYILSNTTIGPLKQRGMILVQLLRRVMNSRKNKSQYNVWAVLRIRSSPDPYIYVSENYYDPTKTQNMPLSQQ